jgi:O-antigen/teichoic acid export membrane protein
MVSRFAAIVGARRRLGRQLWHAPICFHHAPKSPGMTLVKRQIIGGVFWVAVETWGRQVAAIATFILLARLLQPEEFGLAVLAMVGPMILTAPVTRGIPEALIQRPTIDDLHLDSAFWLLVGGGAFLSALLWSLSGVIAWAFGQSMLRDLVQWTSITIVMAAASAVPSAILRRRLEFRLIALRSGCGSVAGGVVGVWMALSGHGVWSLVALQIAKIGVEVGIILVGVRWRPRLRFSWKHCTDLFGFALPVTAQSLWVFVSEELPKVILGALIGPQAVGIYALARRPLDIMTEALITPINAISFPAISRLQSDTRNVNAYFGASVRVANMIVCPAFAGFAAIAPLAIPVIFGAQWAQAVLPAQMLLLLGLWRAIEGVCVFSLMALGYSRIVLGLSIVTTAVTALFVASTAHLGVEAATAALVLSNLPVFPLLLLLAQRFGRIDVWTPLQSLPRILLACGVMFALVTVWRLHAPEALSPLALITTCILIGAAVYGICALAFLRPDVLNASRMLFKMRS